MKFTVFTSNAFFEIRSRFHLSATGTSLVLCGKNLGFDYGADEDEQDKEEILNWKGNRLCKICKKVLQKLPEQ